MNWYPSIPDEVEFLWNWPNYWGPGSTDYSLDPVNPTDRAAIAHDLVYGSAPHTRSGRVQRMEADARMAKNPDTGSITSAFMTVQSGFRLLTMNYVPLPWD